MQRVRFAAALVLVLVVSACGSRGSAPQPPPSPPVQAMAIAVHDFVRPSQMLADVTVTCGGIVRGQTNVDGYLVWEAPSGVLECVLEREGYEPQTAAHAFTVADTTLRTWMRALAPVEPEIPAHPDPLVGLLRLCGSAFCDDTGTVLPRYAHAGNLFARWVRGEHDRVRAEFVKTQQAGYHGFRVWTTLGGSWWAGDEVGPDLTPQYWSQLEAFVREAQRYNLRFVFSQGDVGQIRDLRGFMQRVADLERSITGPPVFDVIDCGNEAYTTGPFRPAQLAECITWYQQRGGRAIRTLTDAPTLGAPDFAARMDEWSIPPAQIFDIHSWRGGRWWDKRRHIWGYTYCGEGCPRLPTGIMSEPPGSGDLVSVTDNKHELDHEAVAMLGVASMLGRSAFVWFSGEGIKLRRGLDTEQGFASTPRAIRLLPKDVMTFQEHHHSGDRFRGVRVLAAVGEVRIDGRQHLDGRFAYTIDGPSGSYALRVERSFEGQLCHPGTGQCTAVARRAGQSLDVNFTRGRVFIGRVVP